MLHLVPGRSRQAKDFVRTWHRHHPPPTGQVFAVGAADETGILRTVAIVGRPVARHLDDGATLVVTRTASDGTRNGNSLLYGAAWRAAKALGYRRLVTYTQDGESGASLCSAGWRVIASRPPRAGWHTASRPRADGPWKYYDLGEGYCSYDFFAKCPHRLACARCPFYVPKQSSQGQRLALKDGIDQMLERLDLTDDEREALEGDREAVTALAERLADTPNQAAPRHVNSEPPTASSP